MGRKRRSEPFFDIELDDLPQDLRWREWMGRVEAAIFASPKPMPREALARIVGRDCQIDALIEDIRIELRSRPYELVAIAGGWQYRTKRAFADAIRAAIGVSDTTIELSPSEHLVLTAIAYFQPITRSELCQAFGKEISRDVLADLRSLGLIASGPRSPRPGAPYKYVTTPLFLSRFGFNSLRDLPDMLVLEKAGMLSKHSLLSGDLHEFFVMDEEKEGDHQAVYEV